MTTNVVGRLARLDDDDSTPVGIDISIGTVVVVAAACVAAFLPTAEPGARLTVMALAVGLYAVLSYDALAVACIVALAWFVQDGFLVDRFGVLSWRGWPDVARLGLLAGAGAVGLIARAVEEQSRG